MKQLRYLTLILTVVFCSVASMAQSSQGDKFYNQGLSLQKTMTVQSQNQAITKFQQAKKFYDSAAKKKQCDDAIAVSRQIIESIKSKGSKPVNPTGPRTPVEPVQTAPKATLELGATSFEVSDEYRKIPVSVSTNQDEWDVNVITASDGTSFLKVMKSASGSNEFDITVEPNETTATRQQKVRVTAGDKTEYITVTQTGVPVKLEVSESVIKFKAKGGSKEINVLCNSSEQYVQNFGENWYVEMCPDWIDITIGAKKDDGKVKELTGKATDAVKGFFGKKSKAEADPDMIVTPITVTVQNVDTDEQAYRQGRTFKVRLRSGSATVEFLVQQERKK